MRKVILTAGLALLGMGSNYTHAVAAAFTPDREFLFQRCAVLNNYDMAGTQVVPRGRTRLTDSMKQGLNELIDVWEKHGDIDPRRLAFVLATARRESQSTFDPIREAPKCGEDEQCRERAIGRMLAERAERKGVKPRANYAAADAAGRRYYGRGFIQLTFERNYEWAGGKLGIDLVNDPNEALEPKIAAEILVRAMLEGWYGSNQPLAHYIDGSKADWINARNNVNPGSPNKPVTAAYAKDLNRCLRRAS